MGEGQARSRMRSPSDRVRPVEVGGGRLGCRTRVVVGGVSDPLAQTVGTGFSETLMRPRIVTRRTSDFEPPRSPSQKRPFLQLATATRSSGLSGLTRETVLVTPMDARTVADYDPAWPSVFGVLGAKLRAALGPVALRIDHIGSTAVPGLDAKPIIDVQISVAAFEPLESFLGPLEDCGFVYRHKPEELSRRFFRERPGARRTHIHVRRAGSFTEQLNLLHRDYLRADPPRVGQYARCKHSLAHLLLHTAGRQAYVDAKGPFVWETLRLAEEWADRTGWEPGPTDA